MESFWYVDEPLNFIVSDIAQFVKNAPRTKADVRKTNVNNLCIYYDFTYSMYI